MNDRPPDITRGLGQLTPRRWHFLWDRIFKFDEVLPIVRRLDARDKQRNVVDWFTAALLGYKQSTANVWLYSWKQVVFNPSTGRYEVNGLVSDVDADPFGLPARNRIETMNTGAGIESGGVNVGGADYPATWYLQPIQGGPASTAPQPVAERNWTLAEAPIVRLDYETHTDGSTGYWFSMMNAHDGTCPP